MSVPKREQQAVIDSVLAGKNVFMTGGPGKGKSATIGFLVVALEKQCVDTSTLDDPKPDYYLTASSGVAASLIGGCTVYSWAGIGLGEDPVSKTSSNMTRIIRSARKFGGEEEGPAFRILTAKYLIIDEISMLPLKIFILLDQLCRDVRKLNGRGDELLPFGGIVLVATGDFFQLGPIPDNHRLCPRCGSKSVKIDDYFECSNKLKSGHFECLPLRWDNKVRYCFEADRTGRNVWDECGFTNHLLVVSHRHKNIEFAKIIESVRLKSPDCEEGLKLIRARCGTPLSIEDGIVPTRLYPHNKKVDEENEAEYAKLESAEMVYLSKTGATDRWTGERVVDSPVVAILNRRVTAPDRLTLKAGAQVIFLINDPPSSSSPLVNGSRGVVIGFDDVGYPIVDFFIHNKPTFTKTVMPHTYEHSGGGHKVYKIQVPLRLAWALTIHKSQGMTISKLEIDFTGVFGDGSVNVALSRATSFEGLFVKGLRLSKITVSPAVVGLYKAIELKKRKRKRKPDVV
jgi:ATP-dependent DNA helicase PIF1